MLNKLTAAQCRAGRSLLGWTQAELSERASVNTRTLMDFESGKRSPNPATLKALANALIDSGVTIIEADQTGGDGVRVSKPSE